MLAGLTGRGVRIAVIDSGIHPDHPHIASVAGGVAVHPGGSIDRDSAAWLDRIGHGTAVAAAIQEKAPEAALFAVRVFHDALRTSASTLLHAIGWCLDEGMDIINLSLGTTNTAHAARFEEAGERAMAAGALIVAARDVQGTPCYPGGLASVLGVELDWDLPRDRFRARQEGGALICTASGYPRSAPGVPPTRNLHGISFAVANVSGFVAQAREAADGDADRARALILHAVR